MPVWAFVGVVDCMCECVCICVCLAVLLAGSLDGFVCMFLYTCLCFSAYVYVHLHMEETFFNKNCTELNEKVLCPFRL